MTKDETTSIFILISLFLIAIIIIFQLIQFIFWLIVVLKTKKKHSSHYQGLLEENIDCQVVKTKISFKFFNYSLKNNTLKLKSRDFNETTTWNKYQVLSCMLVIKWKNNYQKRRNLSLPIINLFLMIGIFDIIICALLYYIPELTKSSSNFNQEVLDVFSFIGLIIITMSWLFWTMFYEKFRKELLELTSGLTEKEFKIIKCITLFKSCFPFADLMF